MTEIYLHGSRIDETYMTLKRRSEVVTPFLYGVDVQAPVKYKKRRLLQTRQKGHSGLQRTPAMDGHDNSKMNTS